MILIAESETWHLSYLNFKFFKISNEEGKKKGIDSKSSRPWEMTVIDVIALWSSVEIVSRAQRAEDSKSINISEIVFIFPFDKKDAMHCHFIVK